MGCTGHCLGCKKEMYGIDLCDECREKLDKYDDLVRALNNLTLSLSDALTVNSREDKFKRY